MRKMNRVLAVSRIVLFWMLLRRIEGEASSEETEIVASKVLPVVINTWGPPFTNATAEGRDGTVINVASRCSIGLKPNFLEVRVKRNLRFSRLDGTTHFFKADDHRFAPWKRTQLLNFSLIWINMLSWATERVFCADFIIWYFYVQAELILFLPWQVVFDISKCINQYT